MVRRILFVDNNPDFREERALCLRERGYNVVTAGTVEDAERVLREELIHVAILDIRLMNDADPKDLSGLVLARKREYQAIPKVMLTLYPRVPDVRDALRAGPDTSAPAVDYLAKLDGVDAMLTTIDEVFDKHVRLNWTLDVEASDRHGLTIAHIAKMIDQQASAARASELEDVFRRLFPVEQQVRIDRLLWHRTGRVALAVFAFARNSAPQSFLIVCASADGMREETRRYDEWAPKVPTADALVLGRSATTLHFGARAYFSAGWSFDRMGSLKELYRTGPEKSFNTVLTALFTRTLAEWTHNGPVVTDETFGSFFRRRLNLTKAEIGANDLELRVEALVHQSSALEPRLELVGDRLQLHLGGRVLQYPNPARMNLEVLGGDLPTAATVSAGWITGDNILTDREHRAWVTDFGDAGLAPLVWDVVALEADIRFDWTEVQDLGLLHEFEEALTTAGIHRLDVSQVEAPLRKPLRAIQTVRRLAGFTASRNAQHQAGLWFQTIRRLADFDPATRLLPSELIRLVHVLIAAAMLSSRIARSSSAASSASAAGADSLLAIDKMRGVVLIEGRETSMPRQSFELLSYLHAHANRLCARRDIFEHIFQMPFDENDESHVGRLTTAVRRLRERIEPDPERPQYLLTETGRGYRLIC